jgi:serine/threonine protein kinase/Tol biopolymer transport system component
MTSERWRQIEELYQAARDPAKRAAVLAGAAPELRREVEALLKHDEAPATQTVVGAGTQLGPYKLEAQLGAGGMGEVFRATDTRLHRTVAIKILPHDKVADPERKRRFLQEARAASALNHPNIVTLHDIASDNGIDYLVMEYVPGTSLDKLITPKGLPLAEASNYAQQIASALAAAHAAGIVHRDMKPANVMVTSESQVKVLDFGLAKLTERVPGPEGETLTQESSLTEAGTVMGTVGYMSPEQASAHPLDHRTDIFSLGVVLYEMIAGQRPFRGKSQVETLHAIIHDPVPPLATVPPRLAEIIDKALEKEPKERYQSAGDVAVDLRRLGRAVPAARIAPPSRVRPLMQAAAAALVLEAGAAGWILHRAPDADNPLANAQFTRLTDFPGDESDANISPDGKFVAFLADRDGPVDIWLSQIGAGRFVNLTQGREPNLNLHMAIRAMGFSGDGSQLWLHDADAASPVRIMPSIGGQPRIFLGTRTQNVAWSPDGARIVYHTSDPGDPTFVADRSGGNARQIFVDRPGVHNHYPAWSPDGRWIYFVRGVPAANEMDLWRIAPSGGEAERLTHHNSFVGYSTPIDKRTVLYVARAADSSGPWLWALDVERKLTRRVSFGLEKYTSVASSADGRRLVATVANPVASLWSVPILDGPAEERDVKPFPVPTVRALMPRFGAAALFYLSSRGMGDGLWRYQDGQAQEIWNGADASLLEPPAVSLDGRRVAFVLRRSGKLRLQTETADGTEPQVVGENLDVQGTAGWSPDGKWIVTGGSDGKSAGLFKIPVEGGAPVRLAGGSALNPVWSPDGSLIAYAGANVGLFAPLLAVHPDGTRIELPVINLNRDGERIRFLPNGKGLVYMQGQGASQDFRLLDLVTKMTRPLTHLNNGAKMRTFDITPDGRQIVFDRLRENSDIVLIDLPERGK